MIPSIGKFPDKINPSADSTSAIASDCGATRIHNKQQSPLDVVESKSITFSELTAAQLAAKLSENIRTFLSVVWFDEDVPCTAEFFVVAASELSQVSDVKSF